MNKQIFFLGIIIFNIIVSGFAETLHGKYYSDEGYFNFINNKYEYFNINLDNGKTEKATGGFTLSEDSFGNAQISFIDDATQPTRTMRYFCFEDYLILYKDSEVPYFIGNSNSARKLEALISTEVKASSFLKEKNYNFSPEKITFWGNLNYVWAEGVSGQGIGEKLFLKNKGIKKLYILPGYVSIKRPDLFNKNSRPKKIKISIKKNVCYFSLIDKPVFQVLDLNSVIDDEIIIEILEVYPGTKYEDTCISSILCSR